MSTRAKKTTVKAKVATISTSTKKTKIATAVVTETVTKGRKRRSEADETTAVTAVAASVKKTAQPKKKQKVSEEVTVETTTTVVIESTAASSKKKPAAKTTSKKKGKAGKAAAVSANGSDGNSIEPASDGAAWKFGTVSRELEQKLNAAGKNYIVGVDEAGRGPLAGPVVSAAIYIPPSVTYEGVNDSKILTEGQRESLYEKLTSDPSIVWSVTVLDHTIIDKINILEATLLSMEQSVAKVEQQLQKKKINVQHVLVDGNKLPRSFVDETKPPKFTSEFVIKGDGRAYSIAAASILAKVTRDRIMMEYHEKYPQYDFASHKGYGVASHMAKIHRFGPCPIHRMTFAPMKHMKKKTQEEREKEAEEKKKKAEPKKRTTSTSKKAAQ